MKTQLKYVVVQMMMHAPLKKFRNQTEKYLLSCEIMLNKQVHLRVYDNSPIPLYNF